MDATIIAVVAMAAASAAGPFEPAVADAVNGAFVRLLAHDPVPLAQDAGTRVTSDESDFLFERWVARAARGEMSGPERAFASMSERVAYVPAALKVRGEPDEVDRLVADVLRPQTLCVPRMARR